jgi:hypothetical protein
MSLMILWAANNRAAGTLHTSLSVSCKLSSAPVELQPAGTRAAFREERALEIRTKEMK